MKQFIDRGTPLEGLQTTSRDTRVPFNYLRELENFSLPDKKARRRKGFTSLHDPVRTQALAKHTGVTFSKNAVETDYLNNISAVTPLSYGLIKYNSLHKLQMAVPATIEFSLRLGAKEELVKNPFRRSATRAAAWTDYELRKPGVFVLDRTVLSNYHKFNTGVITTNAVVPAGTTYDLSALLAADQFDVFPLTAICVGYTETEIFVQFMLVASSGGSVGVYRKCEPLTFAISSYNEGDIYHIAIRHDPADPISANGAMRLYVNGANAGSLTDTFKYPGSPYVFAGEYDVINGITYASGLERDTVILNECTVRGSYSSACKIRDTMHGNSAFFQDVSTDPNIGAIPLACSPPKGTAMMDLRFWFSSARSAANIAAWKNKRIYATDSPGAELVANWHLNDGGPICKNDVAASVDSVCSIHHGYPGFVDNADFLNGIGVKLAEGQHLIRSFSRLERDLGIGIANKLTAVFDPILAADAYLEHREQHSFTVQIQFSPSEAFQAELNSSSADPSTMRDLSLTETRKYINLTQTPYDISDGNVDPVRQYLSHPTETVPGYITRQSARAFDQTLWSIEGTQIRNANSPTNEGHRRRVPVARGMLTPDGHVVFELYKNQTGVLPPMYLRLLSSTVLNVNNVYTVTFVQRALYTYASSKLNADGWKMEIWIQDITAGTAAVLDSSHTEASASTITTSAYNHEQDYDIIVGTSAVNDGWDQSINMPFPSGAAVAVPSTSYVSGGTSRADTGPWPVQQRFMSPYQDQPANMTVGMFRMWSNALLESQIKEYGNSSITTENQSSDLLFNLEFDGITGVEVPSRSRYPDSFKLGFKSWGMPQGYRNEISATAILSAYFKREMYTAAWAMEDCLGYVKIDSTSYDARQQHTKVNGLAPFKSTYAHQYGAVAVYDDCVAYDTRLGGDYAPLFLTGSGLMSEFIQGQDWKGTVVSERLILTSPGALPKVFNGKTCTTAGFRRWSGGVPKLYKSSGGGLTTGDWFGVAVVYTAEEYGIYHVSPVVVCKLDTGDALDLFDIPAHPDPRVSVIEIYRTIGQPTESLALSAPLYKTRVSIGSNAFTERAFIDEADTDLSGTVLDRNVTELPVCAFSAEANGRLYLAGDPLNPDYVYWSDPGNPERIDAFANNIKLNEGTGDEITGIVSMLGTVFIFKPNAVWRMDDVGGGRHQLTRVASVGAISPKSIAVISDPDSSRQMIFFWSQNGPYLLDSVNGPQYIGSAIEGFSDNPYDWLNPSSVVVGHYTPGREIICAYVPIRSGVELDRVGEAMVFNYRYRSWYRYTGISFNNTLSLSFTGATVATSPVISHTYDLLIGNSSGRLFTWGTAEFDGAPYTITQQRVTIDAVPSAGVYNIPDFTYAAASDLTGAWITVVSAATGDWINLPIDSTDNSLERVTVGVSWLADAPFTPAVDDLVYLCQPPATVEFPWDELETPMFDKKIIKMILWYAEDFYYRLNYNYEIDATIGWTPMADSGTQRHKVEVSQKCESVKLEVASFELGARFDALVYEIDVNKGSHTAQ